MKFTFDSEIFAKEDLNVKEFAVLLYYMDKGLGTLNEEICHKLWNKDLLIKVFDGYEFNVNHLSKVEGWLATCSLPVNKINRTAILADKLRAEFPEGKKEGTISYWKDSSKIIAQKLNVFIKKYGDNYTDEQMVAATKRYVQSFNGNYTYMQLLKYFINKKDLSTGEDRSELLSYLENEGADKNKDNGELI